MKINTKISRYNNSSRNGAGTKYIVVHWVGAVSTAKNNADYFNGGDRQASAHFFVDDNEIWQSVSIGRASWHCGGGRQSNKGGTYLGKCTNSNSIGIEMCCKKKDGKLYITDKTIANTGELVRYLMKKYNIPQSRVIRHFDVNGKFCPGPYCTDSTWKALKAKLVNGSTTITTTTITTTKTSKLTVDGSFGSATIKRTQKLLGTTQDGVVSNQPNKYKKYLPAATSAWQFKSSGYIGGSSMIKKLQRLVGVKETGYCDKNTVIALQKFLNKTKFSCGDTDGYMGKKTVKAWQNYLNSKS